VVPNDPLLIALAAVLSLFLLVLLVRAWLDDGRSTRFKEPRWCRRRSRTGTR
jgi:hypothetical protein